MTYRFKQLHLRPDTMNFSNLLGRRCYPKYWGSDRLTRRPSRWISQSSSLNSDILLEELWTPPKGSFPPCSDGPRGCPGKRSVQVECVAATAGLFHKHQVEIMQEDGETQQVADKRVEAVVEDSTMVLLLRMMKPGRAALRWVRKE